MEGSGSGGPNLSGTVRISTPDGFGAFVLVPNLLPLRSKHPNLRIEIVTETRHDALATRQFDLAVTLERPRLRAVEITKLADYQLGLYATGLGRAPAAHSRRGGARETSPDSDQQHHRSVACGRCQPGCGRSSGVHRRCGSTFGPRARGRRDPAGNRCNSPRIAHAGQSAGNTQGPLGPGTCGRCCAYNLAARMTNPKPHGCTNISESCRRGDQHGYGHAAVPN